MNGNVNGNLNGQVNRQVNGQVSLSDFELGPVLGQGGMATVYKAHFIPTGETVALKLMAGGLNDDAVFLERFRREADATSRLEHDNICRVIAAGQSDGKLFMALELIDGGSVRDLKARFGGTMPTQLATEITVQLLAALAEAHKHGIIHRDLKPANLMLTKSGLLKLVDFGIAKSNNDVTLTATGMLVGTPAYMSPEQVRGDPLDGRSDLFSAGLILHDLLIGKSPFFSDNPATSLMKVMRDEVPAIFDSVFGVDPVLEAAHARLTMKNPAGRYVDAIAAIAAMKPYVEKVRAAHPRLIAEALDNPAGIRQVLLREQANAEVARANLLMQRHGGPVPAAALALENAINLDPSLEPARLKLKSISPLLGFQEGVVDDPRIRESVSALEQNPNNPGVLKRLAELHRAKGSLREAAKYLRRYLRLKEDPAALQQLTTLLYGPNSDPALVSMTLPRLQTMDIVQGVKTGGMPAIRPDKPIQRPPTIVNLDLAAAQSARASVVAAAVPDDGAFQRFREAFGSYMWVALPLLLVLGIIFIAAKGVTGGVNLAQKDMKRHVENEAITMQNQAWGMSRTSLFKAEELLKTGDAVRCIIETSRAMEANKNADLMLDAYWLRAQCNLLRRDKSAAEADLRDFTKYAQITDSRRQKAQEQLDALMKGKPVLPIHDKM